MSSRGVIRSTVINLIGQVVPTLVALATVPLYLHWVGEVKYGVLLLAFTMLGYFGAFDFGLGRAVAQRVAGQEDVVENNRTFWTALTFGLSVGLIGGLVLYALGHWLFAGVFRIPPEYHTQVVDSIPWLAMTVPLVSTLSVLTGTLQAKQAFIALNAGQAIGSIALQVFPLIWVAMGHASMSALVSSALFGRLTGLVFIYWAVVRALPIFGAPRMQRGEIASLLRFGGWISLSGMLIPLLTIVDRMVIGVQLGAAAVTAYTVPFSLTQRVTYIPLSLATTLFPKFSQLRGESAERLMHQSILGLVALQTPVVVLGVVLTQPFFQLWLGNEMAVKMVPIAIVLLVGIWINGPAYVPNVYMPAQGRPDLMAKFYVAELLPFLALLWVLVGQWGIVGAGIAWVVRSTADAIFCFVATRTLGLYWKAILPNFPAIMMAVWSALAPIGLIPKLIVGLLALAVSLIASWYVSPLALRDRVLTALRIKTARATSKS
ncbi:teichoic acid transporter [Acidihalobacter yilgarnensis]|uniref:Teichoic acid transporter n=1 Tax=Acidihalobacter yilgarnensis TaxID=2819280 RepID=A0A1D8IQE2_9GAMM|nr:flippase [Acidihalobacter yilgarnensis]AOU98656.1 teichoic acid transporter [Acidihalobacter yilgarnensis]